jgi:MFS family permease
VPPRKVFLSRAFLAIALSQATVGFATVALIVHIIPFMELHGISKTAAATAVTIYTLVSLVGRLGCGYLADRYSKHLVLAGACAVVALGTPLLAFTTTLTGTLLVLLLIAPGFGGTIPVRPAVLADYFGTRYFGTVNGVMSLVQTLGAFFGPWLVGLLVDETGSYTAGWLICAAFAALSVPLMLLATPPRALIDTYRSPIRTSEAAS